jgi:hypothetical protein
MQFVSRVKIHITPNIRTGYIYAAFINHITRDEVIFDFGNGEERLPYDHIQFFKADPELEYMPAHAQVKVIRDMADHVLNQILPDLRGEDADTAASVHDLALKLASELERLSSTK